MFNGELSGTNGRPGWKGNAAQNVNERMQSSTVPEKRAPGQESAAPPSEISQRYVSGDRKFYYI